MMKLDPGWGTALACLLAVGALGLQSVAAAGAAAPTKHRADRPLYEAELLFKPETWHNHGSSIVETARGDLLVCWFHGSGERKADDVRVEGARLRRGSRVWSERFVMADTPGYPDCNPVLFVDPQNRLWLMWPTILANLWESALMKYQVSDDYHRDGPPRWTTHRALHVTPGDEFVRKTEEWTRSALAQLKGVAVEEDLGNRLELYAADLNKKAGDKLTRRLGWMTRNHPVLVNGNRLLVPLYSDGFSFSLMAYTEDWGETWHASEPLPGPGNIQPAIGIRRDGSLLALMRDNGPPPKRLLQSESRDGGLTWSPVIDSTLPNPGASADLVTLRNGHFVAVGNDTERGRHRLIVWISEDEGRTWKWKRYLERDEPGPAAGSYHYPSLFEARDGSLHITYSHHRQEPNLSRDGNQDPARKTIKHARFNEAWVMEGDR